MNRLLCPNIVLVMTCGWAKPSKSVTLRGVCRFAVPRVATICDNS
jgi:hypothetical protein